MMPNEKYDSDRRKISQGIQSWLRKRELKLYDLARQTGHSEDYVRRIINCEPVKIELAFLQSLVVAFNPNPTYYRIRSPEETPDILTWDECIKLLEPPPPRQNRLWDYEK